MSGNAVLLGMLDIMTSGLLLLLYFEAVLLFVVVRLKVIILLAKTACCRQVGSSLLCISEVSISNICPETHYPERFFVVFLSLAR